MKQMKDYDTEMEPGHRLSFLNVPKIRYPAMTSKLSNIGLHQQNSRRRNTRDMQVYKLATGKKK